MEKVIHFVAGIHGVGKSTYCKYIAETYGIVHYSASDLIKRWNKTAVRADKKVANINDNQDILISAINEYVVEDLIILDGHFCLLNEEQVPEKVPETTFKKLNLASATVMHDDVEAIINRIGKRDSTAQNINVFEALQNKEIAYAKELSKRLSFPIFYKGFAEKTSKMEEFFRENK